MTSLHQYKTRHLDFEVALQQATILALVASQVLKDFPKALPDQTARDLTDALRGFFETGLEVASEASGNSSTRTVTFKEDPSVRGLTAATLDMFMAYFAARHGAGETWPARPSFSEAVSAQQLVMALAQLDGFLADSLRAICHAEPRVLRRDKKLSWSEVIAAGSWDGVVQHMIERYVYEFGWGTVGDRIVELRERFALNLPVWETELEEIRTGELLRHQLIHNGGRASAEYLKETQRSDVHIGDLLPVTQEFVTRVTELARSIARHVFIGVAKKFFSASEDDVARLFPPAEEDSGGAEQQGSS